MSDYNYTEQVKFTKKPAGEVVDSLVRLFMASNPRETYQTGLDKVLSLHENSKLAEAYGRSPQELIGP